MWDLLKSLLHLFLPQADVSEEFGLFWHPHCLQAPLSRFCDTAANAGLLAALETSESTSDLPLAVKTVRLDLKPKLCALCRLLGRAGLHLCHVTMHV